MLQLARALLARDDGFRYTVFHTRDAIRDELAAADGAARFWRISLESPWLRLGVGLPVGIRRAGVNVIHAQYGLPAFTRTPAVITVHDLFFASSPELYPLSQRLQLRLRVPRALRAARRVIVPSEFTKREVVSFYGVDERKVRVIPLGASDAFRPLPPSDLFPMRAQYGLPEEFILFVGALQPRKNLTRLIAAVGALPAETRRACPLVIAGPKGWMCDDLRAAAEPLINEGSVRMLGYVPNDHVAPLMNLATVFAFPSLSEGFGLPVVEAMRCGTCVLAGDAGSLTEIVADAGLLVNPLDVGAIAAGLKTLLQHHDLRIELAERGKRRASRYSWERTAEATAMVYREVLTEWSLVGSRNGRTHTCPA